MLDHGFYVCFSFDTPTKKILWLRDKYHCDVAFISLQTKQSIKSEGSFIQFVGHFWYCWSDYLDFFCTAFGIDKSAPDRVRRFDYCFDMYGSTTDFAKCLFSNKGHISNYSDEGESSGLKIWVGDKKDSKTHEIGLYDKKLDTLVKKKYIWDIPDSPYKKQLEHEGYISRLEVRFFSRACRRFVSSDGSHNTSVNRILQDGETLAYQYASRWFNLPFDYTKTYSRTTQKKDNRIQKLSDKKINLYKSQAYAYLDNIRLLGSQKDLFEWFRYAFPEIDDHIMCSIVQKGYTVSESLSPIDNRGTLIDRLALQKQIYFPYGYDIYQKYLLIIKVMQKRIFIISDLLYSDIYSIK